MSTLELLLWCWGKQSRGLYYYWEYWIDEAENPPGRRG